MKRYFVLGLAITIAGFAAYLYQRRSFDRWYGSFQIGDSAVVSLISVGHDVFHDANSDGVPQGGELVGPNGKVKIASPTGEEEYTLENVSLLLVPELVSSDLPQIADVTIQSNQNANVWQVGTVTMSLDKENVETCHLMGPLSFLLIPEGLKLTAGEANDIKIAIGTSHRNDSPDTGALICTSPIGDRTSYAFADSERPKLKIWFGDQSTPPEELVVDSFC